MAPLSAIPEHSSTWPPPKHHATPAPTNLPSSKKRKVTEIRSIPVDDYSSTEPDDSDYQEAVAQKYLGKTGPQPSKPLTTIYGPGVDVYQDDTGIKWHVRGSRAEDKENAEPVAKNTDVEMSDDSDNSASSLPGLDGLHIHRPTPPRTPPSSPPPLSSVQKTLSSPGVQFSLPPGEHQLSSSPKFHSSLPKFHSSPSTPTNPQFPLTKTPLHRPRQPSNSIYHSSTSGLNPAGAHNHLLRRRLPPSTRPPLGTHGQRIVSGSFGSFEAQRPSRFDERQYRLGGAGEKNKREEKVEEKKWDVYKGRPWLRQG